MTEDFFNGLDIVPLDANHSIHSIHSAAGSPAEHPFRPLFRVRAKPPPTSSKAPESDPPPAAYSEQSLLRSPKEDRTTDSPLYPYGLTEKSYATGEVEVHETVRMQDVEAFRLKTSEAARMVTDANANDMERQMADRVARLRIGHANRPVIYRYVDVVKGGLALLEAIHFELFMPDRPDLRFLAVPVVAVPQQTVEGDYFHVADAALLDKPSFGVRLGYTLSNSFDPLEYPVVWRACGPVKMIFEQKEERALAYVFKQTQAHAGGDQALSSLFPAPVLLRSSLYARPSDCRDDSLLKVSVRQSAAAHLYPVEPPIAPGRYVVHVRDVRTSAQREARVISRVRVLTDVEKVQLDDRFGLFTGYGKKGDVELMKKLFLIGCRLRQMESTSDAGLQAASDAGETRIDEGVILTALIDDSLDTPRALLDAVYGRSGPVIPVCFAEPKECIVQLAGSLRLNREQARALHYYTADERPRVLCILSPPGSGKTTLAATIVAMVARRAKEPPVSYVPTSQQKREVQLLLSVQNAAIDNIGAALKKMGHGGGLVYNMKSTTELDPNYPAPFDLFDLAGDSLKGWQELYNQEIDEEDYMEREDFEDRLSSCKSEFEKQLSPKVILATVEMVLQRERDMGKLGQTLEKVTRVIIDEASLLTEAALFCLMRRFPEAQMVLIGDDKQLPPFMYDRKTLGSQLAGRSALTVAMKTGRVPVVKLTEVYRAPQSLIQPYNRLAYGKRLQSRVAQTESPLSDIGLVGPGLPQLLFVQMDGEQQREESGGSLYHEEEISVVERLLDRYDEICPDDVMIICMYSEQKRRLEAALGDDYAVLTVDSAQGETKPIVILLTTRTEVPVDDEASFFNSIERCNVAISRHQKALIILGYEPLLTTNVPWSTVVNGDDFTRIQWYEI